MLFALIAVAPAWAAPAAPPAAAVDAGPPSSDGGADAAAEDAGLPGDAGSPGSRPVADRDVERQATQRLALERQAAEAARERARQAEQAAGDAREAALREQRRAHSEAVRLLAGERASLEGVREAQARFERRLADQRAQLATLAARLERFRGHVAARAEALLRRTPATEPQFDALYDEVVAQLIDLRPRAVADLWTAIRGVEAPPAPEEMAARLRGLSAYSERFASLQALHETLTREAEELEQRHVDLVDKRLALLQREVSWLNEHRIALLAHVSAAKRRNLTGLSRATLNQLTREISQLVFDAVYWSQKRLRQIDDVPTLVADALAVGALLWRALQMLLLLLLVRFVTRHWSGWMKQSIASVGRSGAFGLNSLRAVQLLETLRHSGPALIALLTALLLYRLAGGRHAATEIVVIYSVFFWFAVYWLQLRVVESAARFAGMERTLREARERDAGGFLEYLPEGFDGPPVPRVREPTDDVEYIRRTVSGPVLAVRTVRAVTRYLLAVVIVLELTAIAVGKGTIYGLTVKFSWWAAVPFVLIYLDRWKPHIVTAYRRLIAGRPPGRLARAVSQSSGKIYEVVFVAAAFAVVFANRAVIFAKRHLLNLDATKRLLAFLFRRQVAKHARESGRIVEQRQEIPRAILAQFPSGAIDRSEGALIPPVMERLREAFAGWQDKRADGSVALVGAAGMGKSTVVRLLSEQLHVPVIRAELKTKIVRSAKVVSWLTEVFGFGAQVSSENDLVRLIRAEKRPIVALDGCHDLFLRRVGGFEGWDTFVRIVNATCDKVFWVMTFNRGAWDYLYNFGGQVQLFRLVLRIPPWSERWIQRLIMHRMAKSGFDVSFSDLVIAQVPDLEPLELTGRTSSGYFRMLWDYTDGNPRLATHFWLDSLIPDAAARRVRVNLFAEPSIALLEELPADTAFVLTAIAEHENLNVEEAAKTTGLSRDFCAFAFASCVEDGLLESVEGTHRWRLSTRWQQATLRFLRRRHLLYTGA